MKKRTFMLTAPALILSPTLRAVAPPAEAFHATANSRITLLYMGSVSCPACRGYEAEYFGRLNRMATNFPEFGKIDYLKLSMAGGKAGPTSSQLPAHLQWIATEQRNGEAIIKNLYGTPYFLGVVDREVWAQAPAVSGLESEVIPALRRAVSERKSAA
jgi:hypothetical protein